jgi:hypothetical protein
LEEGDGDDELQKRLKKMFLKSALVEGSSVEPL